MPSAKQRSYDKYDVKVVSKLCGSRLQRVLSLWLRWSACLS